MSKTVAVISDSGLLTDAIGRNKESDARYAKFAKRLIGAGGTTAVINYGWNGASKLAINKEGARGQLITLDAESVVVSGDLSVGGMALKDIINACTDLAIQGIRGTEHEISVNIRENEDSDEDEQSRLICTISLDPEVISRISAVEKTLEDLFRFEEVYRIGSGLKVIRDSKNTLVANLGDGLKFESPDSSDSDDDNAAITLDIDQVPTQGSKKPVTSGGVYAAIHGGQSLEYSIGIDPTTGNMMLYHNEED